MPSTHTTPFDLPGGSRPSTYTTPLVTHGGSGPATHTVLFTTLGGSGPSTTVPQVPLVMQAHHVPANPTTIATPSHINLGSNLPFMTCLNLPDLAWLTNDPIRHLTFWPPMPTKLPLDIPKFEGKAGECPQNHIMTFHLWFSSNNIIDDLNRLILFQRTLTGATTKWYIELPQAKYPDFNSLASCSCNISNSPSYMTKGWISCYLAAKIL